MFSPLQLHVGFGPHIFAASFQKHYFIKATKEDSFFHANVEDGLGGVFPSLSTVQKAHLRKEQRGKKIQHMKWSRFSHTVRPFLSGQT